MKPFRVLWLYVGQIEGGAPLGDSPVSPLGTTDVQHADFYSIDAARAFREVLLNLADQFKKSVDAFYVDTPPYIIDRMNGSLSC